MICKNCGSEIMERVCQGVGELYHCVDFGDCKPEPLEKVYADSILQQCYEAGYGVCMGGNHPEDINEMYFCNPDRKRAYRRGYTLAKHRTKQKQ